MCAIRDILKPLLSRCGPRPCGSRCCGWGLPRQICLFTVFIDKCVMPSSGFPGVMGHCGDLLGRVGDDLDTFEAKCLASRMRFLSNGCLKRPLFDCD